MALSFWQVLLLLACLSSQSVVFGDDSSDETDVIVEDVKDEVSVYESPVPSGRTFLAENFDNKDSFKQKWVQSQTKKEGIDEEIAKYDGIWQIEEPKKNVEMGNLGLVLKSKARHAAISTKLREPFYFEDKPLIVQYEVIFQEGQECGGGYLKLLSLHPDHKDLKNFHDKTPYTIMFGPDKCGNDHKLHFIFRHKNPLNGSMEEKHAKKPKERLEEIYKDKEPHLYTLIIQSDNSFTIKVDGKVVNDGSLLDDFTPPVNPPLEIEDPDDRKPADWDEREKIADPTAVKPDDWDEDAPPQIEDQDDQMPEGWLEDEPATIPNKDAVIPEDWDEDMDGEWEPPEIPNPKCAEAPGCGPYKKRLISNPNYKGKWLPPLITNPNYRGKWKPKLIHNPNYFNDEHPFKMTPIYAVGFELWSMSPDILFDNIIVTDDEDVAEKWAEDSFYIRKQKIAKESSSLWQQVVTFTAENPWIWSIYIILLSIPVVIIIYCCCFSSQEKEPKEYHEDLEPLAENERENEENEATEAAKDENDDAEDDNDNLEEENVEEENKDEESTEEVIENEVIETKKNISTKTDGPRRRKVNRDN